MHAPPPDDVRASWLAELSQTESACWTYFHKRTAHWILFGAQIWASELLWSPAPERSLPEELLRSASREIELRAEFTTRSFCALAARARHVASAVVLVDCTRSGTELLRDGCRDVENDLVRTARFVPGVDVAVFNETMSRAISRLADHLLEVRNGIEAGPPLL
jgi:hypothetical protein